MYEKGQTRRFLLPYGVIYNQLTVPVTVPRNRPRILDNGDVDFLGVLLQARPTAYLDEFQSHLAAARGIEPSTATISRTFKRVDITNKVVAKESAERNEELRYAWKAMIGREQDPEAFVWLDESGIDTQTVQRRRGWAQSGRACVTRRTFLKGTKYSIQPALTVQGIIALDIVEGAVNKQLFLRFLRERVVSTLQQD